MSMSEKMYMVNEVYRSLQGEGVRAGTVNVFLRLTGCNMRCDVEPGERSPGGFACDTEFMSGRKLTLPDLLAWVQQVAGDCRWIILTGGEPGLQVDDAFIAFFHDAGFLLAIETNGSVELPEGLDWITVSPKVAEHAIKQRKADEVKYVRGYGQGIPKTVVEASYNLISPAFCGSLVDENTFQWCIQLVQDHPEWQLSVQQHKLWNVR